MKSNRNYNLKKSSPIQTVVPLAAPVFIVERLEKEGPDVFRVEKSYFVGQLGEDWIALRWVMGELAAVPGDSVEGVFSDLRTAWAEMGGWGKELRFIEADTWNEIQVPGMTAGASSASLRPTSAEGRRKAYLERYPEVVQAFLTHGDSIRAASARTARAKSLCERIRGFLVLEGRLARPARKASRKNVLYTAL